ncbi:MAG: calcium-binding protein [Nannocystaceae bacterium]
MTSATHERSSSSRSLARAPRWALAAGLVTALGVLVAPSLARADACTGLDPKWATATLNGSTLEITGSPLNDYFNVYDSQGTLGVEYVNPMGTESCAEFSLSAIDEIVVDLVAGENLYSGAISSAIPQTVTGGDSNDWIQTGAGDDIIDGGHGNDTLWGLFGDDHLIGGPGNDTIYGGGDDDTIEGESGDDTLSGDTGNDLIAGGYGADTILGGDGNDWIAGDCDIENERGDLVVALSCGTSGESEADTLDGEDGSDLISGGPGSDSIYGGDGDDYLIGNTGAEDRIWGEGGHDLISDQNDISESSTKWFKAYGGDGNDMIVIEGERCQLEGNAGNDLLVCYCDGCSRDVKLYGHAGDDVLFYSDTFPVAYGGSGSDACVDRNGSSSALVNSCDHFDGDKLDTAFDEYLGRTSTNPLSSEYQPFYETSWSAYGEDDLYDAIVRQIDEDSFDIWDADRSLAVHEVG